MSKHFQPKDIDNYLQCLGNNDSEGALTLLKQRKEREGSNPKVTQSLIAYALQIEDQRVLNMMSGPQKDPNHEKLRTECQNCLVLNASTNNASQTIPELPAIFATLTPNSKVCVGFLWNILMHLAKNRRAKSSLIKRIAAVRHPVSKLTFAEALLKLAQGKNLLDPFGKCTFLALFFKMIITLKNPWEGAGITDTFIENMVTTMLTDPEEGRQFSLWQGVLDLLDNKEQLDKTAAVSRELLRSTIPSSTGRKITIQRAVKQAEKRKKQKEKAKRNEATLLPVSSPKKQNVDQNRGNALIITTNEQKHKQEAMKRRERQIFRHLYDIDSEEDEEGNQQTDTSSLNKPSTPAVNSEKNTQIKTKEGSSPKVNETTLGKPAMNCRSAVCSSAGVCLILFGTSFLLSGSFASYYAIPLLSKGIAELFKSPSFLLFGGAAALCFSIAALCAAFLVVDKCYDKKLSRLSTHSISNKPKALPQECQEAGNTRP